MMWRTASSPKQERITRRTTNDGRRRQNRGVAVRHSSFIVRQIAKLQAPPAILALYTLLAVIMTYPLIFNLTTAVPSDIGDPLLNTWILAWNSHALLNDPLNLFNANIFFPLPNTLAYSEHLAGTAWPALPVLLVSGEPVLAYNLSLLATFPLAAFGMYLLSLHWIGQRRAAFVAGLIFGFAPYRFAAIAHLQLLTFQWLPFALLFLDKIVVNYQLAMSNEQLVKKCKPPGSHPKSHIPNLQPPTPHPTSHIPHPTSHIPHPTSHIRLHLAFTIFLLLQILASWYLAIYTALILGSYLLIALLARRLTLKGVVHFITAFVIVALLILPFAIPYLAQVNELRASRPPELALAFAAAPTDFMAAAPFNVWLGPLTESMRARPGFTEENTLYLGLTAVVLALVPLLYYTWRLLVLRTTRSATRPLHPSFLRQVQDRPFILHPSPLLPLSSLLILIIALTLTFPTPYAFLVSLIPAGTIIRVPPRWVIPALFALADLAAVGYAVVNYQLSIINYQWRGVFKSLFFVICTVLIILEALSIPIPLAAVDNQRTLNPAYHRLAQLPRTFALIELPLHSAPAQEYPEVKRLYASTLGWWPIVNGYSGYTPPRQPDLAQAMAAFPYEQSIATLQEMSAKYLADNHSNLLLLVHPGESPMDRTRWETVDRWQAEQNPALLPLGQFEGDYLYQVLPAHETHISAPPLAVFGLEQTIRLESFTLLQLPALTHVETSRPHLLLYWAPTTTPTADYTIFIHLRAADGYVLAQADGPPVSGQHPTTRWPPNKTVQDIHPLPNIDLAQVDHLAIGFYSPATGQRLPAFDANGRRLPNDAAIIPLPR